ncbi:MAG TPA: OmpA family protein [Chitinophagaceae bacterium]|nr:OmpA family protein [Chitinophagaceae bacterium]
MKKIILLAILLIPACVIQAQLLKKIKEKVDNKVNNTVDKKVDETVNGKKDDNSKSNGDAGNDSKSAAPATLKTYSKYDFVPGEKIIVYEDFMQDAVGDLPAKWNTNSACETVKVDGQQGQWMKMTKPGVFMPDFIDSLPENFTLEFDVMVDQPNAGSWGIDPILAELEDRDKPTDWRNSNNYFDLNILPGTDGNGNSDYDKKKMGGLEHQPGTKITCFSNITKPVHVAMWRQKERLRIYLNEDKTWDVPKAIAPEAKLNAFILFIQLKGDWNFLVSNIRLATGAPDTRKKILEQNKWVTHGILFDVNSATIKPESYGTLKEMATVMKENPDLKVKIVGHTDSDGSDAANLELSKKRAAAVKESLAKDFGIDESRMETDGKGESEPIDKNDTPVGKANNRRVEFIKI